MTIVRSIAAHDPRVIGLQIGRLTSGSRTSFQALTIAGAAVTTWAATLAGTADAQRANTLAQFCNEVFDGLDAAGKTAAASILTSAGTAGEIASGLDRELTAWLGRGGLVQ